MKYLLFEFENALKNLQSCFENWENEIDFMSKEEQEAKKKLLQLCKDIVGYYGEEK